MTLPCQTSAILKPQLITIAKPKKQGFLTMVICGTWKNLVRSFLLLFMQFSSSGLKEFSHVQNTS